MPVRTRGRSRLVRRLRNLRNLEWFNIPFLVAVLSTLWSDTGWSTLWQRLAAYALVAALLGVGGWYWHQKIGQVTTGSPPRMRLFNRVDRIAPWILGGATLGLIGSWMGEVGAAGDRGWATAFLILAWAEYVNYFRVQLMYDTRTDLRRLRRTGGLRRSRLSSDLREWRQRKRSFAGRPHV